MRKFITELFGKSPFGPIVEHGKKVHECVELLWPLMEALIEEDYDLIRSLHSRMSRHEYEADLIKHEIRGFITQRSFLPVDRSDLINYLEHQEKIADHAEDFAVILTLRKTVVNPELHDFFFEYLHQVFQVSGCLLTAAVEFKNLAETAFGGAEAKAILQLIEGLNQEEWKADKLQRAFSRHFYSLEDQLDPTTLVFYDKYCQTLSRVANSAERTAKFLRLIIARK